MEGNYEKLYEGLALVYRGKWIGLIGVVSTVLLVWIPILSFLCMLAALLGGAIVIVGQVKLLSEHKDYKKVLVLVIMAALFNLIEQGISGVVGLCAEYLGSICSLLGLYFLIHATNHFLRQRGREDLAELGRRTLMVNTVCTIAVLVSEGMLAMLAESFGALLAAAGVFVVLAIVSEAFLLRYLRKSRDAV